ncbi:MAG: DUF1501 domain-containing protein [Planctomycetota bacterium]
MDRATPEHLSDRRDFLRASLTATLGLALGGRRLLAGEEDGAKAEEDVPAEKVPGGGKARSVIVLNMAGGMSQLDTFDPKPGQQNAGPLKAISTSAPGLQLSELLPRLAEQGKHLAVIRSMLTREGAHERASYLLHTGYAPSGTVAHPDLGALIAQARRDPARDLPAYVHIGGRAVGAGFIGVDYAPFGVDDPTQPVDNLRYPQQVDAARFERRRQLLSAIERRFHKSHPGSETEALTTVYGKADRLMHSPQVKAFDLSEEPAALRDRYGKERFGQGCLMARRLVEAGVPAVEVALGGWDTHKDNFTQARKLAAQLDAGMAALIADLAERGKLDSTLVLLVSEFGRTPAINKDEGRDHWAAGWSVALAGGGVRGGQAVGATSPDGTKVAARPVAAQDLLASVFCALAVDSAHVNYTREGRPLRVVDKKGRVVRELFQG